MTNPNAFPSTPESQFPPEKPCPYRIGEVITYERWAADRFVVARYYSPKYYSDDPSLPLTIAQYALRENDRTRFGGQDTNAGYGYGMSDGVPISTGRTISVKEFVRLAVQTEMEENIDDLRTHQWDEYTAAILVSAVEQYTADKIAHGEEVTETELALDHARRVRQSDPDSEHAYKAALESGSYNLTPYLEVIGLQ